MIEQYRIKYIDKHAELDTFKDGCIGPSLSFIIEQELTGDTLYDVVYALHEFLGLTSEEAEQAFHFDPDEDSDRVNFTVTETAEGHTPTDEQQKQWRRGKCDLYCVDYCAYITKITIEDVDLSDLGPEDFY